MGPVCLDGTVFIKCQGRKFRQLASQGLSLGIIVPITKPAIPAIAWSGGIQQHQLFPAVSIPHRPTVNLFSAIRSRSDAADIAVGKIGPSGRTLVSSSVLPRRHMSSRGRCSPSVSWGTFAAPVLPAPRFAPDLSWGFSCCGEGSFVI